MSASDDGPFHEVWRPTVKQVAVRCRLSVTFTGCCEQFSCASPIQSFGRNTEQLLTNHLIHKPLMSWCLICVSAKSTVPNTGLQWANKGKFELKPCKIFTFDPCESSVLIEQTPTRTPHPLHTPAHTMPTPHHTHKHTPHTAHTAHTAHHATHHTPHTTTQQTHNVQCNSVLWHTLSQRECVGRMVKWV